MPSIEETEVSQSDLCKIGQQQQILTGGTVIQRLLEKTFELLNQSST